MLYSKTARKEIEKIVAAHNAVVNIPMTDQQWVRYWVNRESVLLNAIGLLLSSIDELELKIEQLENKNVSN